LRGGGRATMRSDEFEMPHSDSSIARQRTHLAFYGNTEIPR
jgi:hypothetical protein